MKKVLNIILICTITICSCLLLVSCGKPKQPYCPELSKTYTRNGFTIQTTADFTIRERNEGMQLISEGDDIVCFGNTYIDMQFDMGNNGYNFNTISLDTYASDVAKIEGITLSAPAKTITITERLNEIFSGNLNLNVYIIDQKLNPNGDWDTYSILCVGKGSNAFVYINIETQIQDKYYDDNITKLTAIIDSIVFQTPTMATYDNSVKSYISTNMVRTGDFMSYFKFEYSIPDNYIAYEIPNYPSGNHLAKNNYPENIWSSSIRCSNLASFMGNTVLDDNNAKHFIKFSTNNYLGFYTKNFEDNSWIYRVYFVNGDNKINVYYTIIGVTYSNDIGDLGFGNYFEEQMISWMQNVIILP